MAWGLGGDLIVCQTPTIAHASSNYPGVDNASICASAYKAISEWLFSWNSLIS